MKKKIGVFFDRDGLINQAPPAERRYVTRPEEFHLNPGTPEAIRFLNEHQVPVGVITNQKGISLGRYSVEDLNRIHHKMNEDLAAYGAHVDDIQYCPHQESDACTCRKPLPGMLFAGAKALGVDLDVSWMVGDQPRDLEAGKAAGCFTLGVGEAAFPPYITDHSIHSPQELPAWFSTHFPFQKADKLA